MASVSNIIKHKQEAVRIHMEMNKWALLYFLKLLCTIERDLLVNIN